MGGQLDGLLSHWQPAFANKLMMNLRFLRPQPDTSLHCETTDTGLVCLFIVYTYLLTYLLTYVVNVPGDYISVVFVVYRFGWLAFARRRRRVVHWSTYIARH